MRRWRNSGRMISISRRVVARAAENRFYQFKRKAHDTGRPRMNRLRYIAISSIFTVGFAACDGRREDGSLLIAPFLQGAYYCTGAEEVPGISSDEEAAKYCAKRHETGAPRIEAALTKIGPSVSPSGR